MARGHPVAAMPRWIRAAAAVLLLLGPVVALAVSPWGANAMWVFYGMLPSVMGLLISARHAAVTAVLTGMLVAAALAFSGVPWAGALLMAVVGAATGLSATRGWNLIGAAAGPSIAVALIGNPQVAFGQGVVLAQTSVATIFAAAAWVAGGGLWVALLGMLVSRMLRPRARAGISLRTAGYFAVGLGILAGVASYVCLRWLDPMSWWIVLTVFVVMRPSYVTAKSRIASRVAGTIVGAVAAAVIVELFQDAPVVITILTFASGAVAAYANVKLPYWVYASFLTPAVVLQAPGGSGGSLAVIAERTGYTLVGAAAAVLVTVIGHALITRRTRRAPTSGDPVS